MIRGALAIGALVAVALQLASCAGSSAQPVSCRPTLDLALTPPGNGPAAFTMGIRVNQASDVDQIEEALRDRILPRDVFVINTEFPGSKPDDWEDSLARISEKFPCNRIVTLTGLSPDPQKPGYEFALVGRPELDAVLVDWEPDTWADAGQGHWTSALPANLARISERLRLLSKRLSATRTRMGLVPDYMPPWDYGRTARVIAEANFALDPLQRGYQMIQSQPNCGTPSAPGPPIGGLTAQLISQYKGVFGEPLRVSGGPPDIGRELLQQLGFEIAFDQAPNPKASEAVERIGPGQAAECTREILKAGGAGVLYWASPQSIRAMLETPAGHSLRTPGSD